MFSVNLDFIYSTTFAIKFLNSNKNPIVSFIIVKKNVFNVLAISFFFLISVLKKKFNVKATILTKSAKRVQMDK